jgi:predicted SnoaL-like aldol condensation-catalyzing enzyme
VRSIVSSSLSLLALACATGSPPSNSSREAQTLVDNWVNAINTGRGLAAIDQYLAADYVWHLPGENMQGREAVKKIFTDMFQKCPHLKTTAEDVVTDGQRVVVRWTETCSPNAPSTSDITIDRFGHGQFLEGWEVDSDKPWIHS